MRIDKLIGTFSSIHRKLFISKFNQVALKPSIMYSCKSSLIVGLSGGKVSCSLCVLFKLCAVVVISWISICLTQNDSLVN